MTRGLPKGVHCGWSLWVTAGKMSHLTFRYLSLMYQVFMDNKSQKISNQFVQLPHGRNSKTQNKKQQPMVGLFGPSSYQTHSPCLKYILGHVTLQQVIQFFEVPNVDRWPDRGPCLKLLSHEFGVFHGWNHHVCPYWNCHVQCFFGPKISPVMFHDSIPAVWSPNASTP